MSLRKTGDTVDEIKAKTDEWEPNVINAVSDFYHRRFIDHTEKSRVDRIEIKGLLRDIVQTAGRIPKEVLDNFKHDRKFNAEDW